jgi:hypothetical protein
MIHIMGMVPVAGQDETPSPICPLTSSRANKFFWKPLFVHNMSIRKEGG